ncbi:N-acetylglucosamine-6-phosphate deacetylase [Sphingobacterium griseoflavum]|uniref:N-acetylglucosamine-6-phosphate deacetylase n=1 Tax=Sphingobacterium griseoflavum TaxID=1474952 RepID=A0ABQ3HY83_9SPHI|nr:N-acetylglucosamine-6-phosphate deacetylase [Sphingobacterium griseoflavum]GHE46647.1 N-acetylglucosamine-6-phosphate deacetylase [Sphingobacterium griseoflavum]
MTKNQKIALVNGRIFNGDDVFLGHGLLMDAGRIQGIFPMRAIPQDYLQVDVERGHISAGLIDLQIYGTGNDLFSAELSMDSLDRIERNLIMQGCTSFMLTLATNSIAVLHKGIEIFKDWQPKAALGLHLEGPFLNKAKGGAHPAKYMLEPSLENMEELLRDAQGVVKMMTIAPELIDQAVVKELRRRGILLSAGHSAASFQEANEGFSSGIQAVTHLWNAMSPFHHRDTGLPGAVFQHDKVKASIIADGVHVDFQALKLSKKLLGDRLFLITDAVATCDKGPYQHVRKIDHYTLPDGTLSGSALTLLQAVGNCVVQADIALEEALRMATSYPAELLGRSDIGNLNTGSSANVLVFDAEFGVQQVYMGGVRYV